MSVDLVAALVFLAPGFLALKVVDILGSQRRRSQWEWTTWSVLASLPISALAGWLRGLVAVSMPLAGPDGWEVAIGLLLGIAVGGIVAAVWRKVMGSDGNWAKGLLRELNDWAWDESFAEAKRHGRAIAVKTDGGDQFRGQLRWGGREAAAAAGWFYLYWPDKWTSGGWQRYEGTHGLLLSRDKVQWVRVYLSPDEGAAVADGPQGSVRDDPAMPSQGAAEPVKGRRARA